MSFICRILFCCLLTLMASTVSVSGLMFPPLPTHHSLLIACCRECQQASAKWLIPFGGSGLRGGHAPEAVERECLSSRDYARKINSTEIELTRSHYFFDLTISNEYCIFFIALLEVIVKNNRKSVTNLVVCRLEYLYWCGPWMTFLVL